MFYNGAGAGLQRPPSRHKDPPMNLGLDLPLEETPHVFVDDDSDDGDAFEIGIANANKKSLHQYYNDEESLDSFSKPSNRGLPSGGGMGLGIDTSGPVMNAVEMVSDFNMNDYT